MRLHVHGPIFVILFANLLMYIHTSMKIFKLNEGINKGLRGSESNMNKEHGKKKLV